MVKALLVRGFTADVARAMIDALHLEARAHEVADAYAAASVYQVTKTQGSGLGERTCMALAISERLPAITTDKASSARVVPGLSVIQAR